MVPMHVGRVVELTPKVKGNGFILSASVRVHLRFFLLE